MMAGSGRRGNPRLAAVVIMFLVFGAFPATLGGALPAAEGVAESPLTGLRITPDDADQPGLLGNPSHAFTHFGSSVDVDGDTLIVGTAFDTGDFRDWVYVFERGAGGSWMQTAKLEASDADVQTHSGFGVSVAIDEDAGVLVVGDPGYDLPSEENAGALYFFERQGDGSWEEVAKFEGADVPGESCVPCHPRFGWSVDLDGSWAVAGAPRLPGPSLDPEVKGAIYVFERVDGTWTRDASLGPYTDTAYDRLGYSVGITGDTIAAGSSSGRPASGEPMGTVSLFERAGGAWGLATTLWPPLTTQAGSPNAVFGFSLDLEGSSLVVGDPGWGAMPGAAPVDKVTAGLGAAYVYDRAGAGWGLAGQLLPPTPHAFLTFGHSVDLSENGDTVVVGADGLGAIIGASPPAGTAYVFQRPSAGAFTLTGELMGFDTSPGDQFGESAAVSGDVVVVGAPFDDNRRDGTPWPFDDQGVMDPALCDAVDCSGPNDGTEAGSVYAFNLKLPEWAGGEGEE